MFLRGKSEFILRFRAKFSSPNNKQNFSKFKHTRISREIWLHPRYYFRVKRRKENSSLSYYFIIRFLKFLKKKKIRFDFFAYNSLQFYRVVGKKIRPFFAFIIRFLKFLNKKKIRFLCIQFVTISHRLQILFVREKQVFYLISFFFFEKGQRFRRRKRKKKEGRGSLIVFIFT